MADQSNNVTQDWPKWKVALAVGAPVAVGLAGVWYYRRRSRTSVPVSKQSQGDAKQTKSTDTEQTPLEKAQTAKNKGNKYFKGGKYDQAITCYTEAIDICPQENSSEISTFYQNRAAAFEQLKNYEKVIEDCTSALDLNKRYTKALFRRAKACEITQDLMQCLQDVTAVCILESFQNQQSLLMADRVLKELGKAKAKEAYKKRKPLNPSPQFIRTYFGAFANDPVRNTAKIATSVSEDTTSEDEGLEKDSEETSEKELQANEEHLKKSPYQQAQEAFLHKEYEEIIRLCSEEIDLAHSKHVPEALLLRATFYHLRGEGNKAVNDFDELLNMDNVDKRIRSNGLIKRGSLKMQDGEQDAALADFELAIKEDPGNADIYHHRGQLNLLMDKIEEAVHDFEKSVSLSPDFPIALVQKCYTEYRLAFAMQSPMQLQSAMKSFDAAIKKFPRCAEGYALFGQALCDQQQFREAEENFNKALQIEPDSGTIYVHRGLLYLQWKQDIEKASELIGKALEVDDKCEFAYETLGTIEVQKGGLDRAQELFHKAISLCKTEIEMAHLFSLLDATIAQARVAASFGISVPMGGMGMM